MMEMKKENSVFAWKLMNAVLWMDIVTRERNSKVLGFREIT